MIQYVAIKNTLFKVKEIVSETNKTYLFRLFGLRGVLKARKNGKDCRLFRRKPIQWW